jgi:methylase of polypeptide subunit release factors
MIGGNFNPPKYDVVIGNPPYMKIPKDAPEATAMPEICYGAPNMYFIFAAMGLFNLKENGEMVYIIPRSWTSGAYFKRFREIADEVGAYLMVDMAHIAENCFIFIFLEVEIKYLIRKMCYRKPL